MRMMNGYFIKAFYEESKKYFYTNQGLEDTMDFAMMYAYMGI